MFTGLILICHILYDHQLQTWSKYHSDVFLFFFQCLKLGNCWVHQDLEIAVQLKDCYVMRTTPVSFFYFFISGAQVAQRVRSLDIAAHTSLSPIWHGFAPRFVNYKKWCTRLAAASDKVYQLLAHGRWFSPGTPASSTTKTGRHDIAEILLKVALKHQKSK